MFIVSINILPNIRRLVLRTTTVALPGTFLVAHSFYARLECLRIRAAHIIIPEIRVSAPNVRLFEFEEPWREDNNGSLYIRIVTYPLQQAFVKTPRIVHLGAGLNWPYSTTNPSFKSKPCSSHKTKRHS